MTTAREIAEAIADEDLLSDDLALAIESALLAERRRAIEAPATDVQNTLDDFSQYSFDGWDGDGSKPILLGTIALAKYVASFFSPAAAPNAAPAGDGSISFEWMLPDGRELWIDIEANGKLTAHIPGRCRRSLASPREETTDGK